MAEQQLVDYIKKARQAGQTDGQTRDLLYKNGWTTAEVTDAFTVLNQAQQVQPTPAQVAPVQTLAQPAAQPQTVKINVSQSEKEPQIQPQTQPQAQPQAQTKTEIKPQDDLKSRLQETKYSERKARGGLGKILKLIIILLAIVVLSGAGLFVAVKYFNLPLNFLTFTEPSPEVVLGKMLENMQNVTSSHTEMQFGISATDASNTSQGNITMSLIGDVDSSVIENPKANLRFSINWLGSDPSDRILSADMEMIAKAGNLYVKANNLNSTGGYYGVNPSEILGQWLKIDKDSTAAISQINGNQFILPDVQQNNNFTNAIKDFVVSNNLLSFNKKFASEVINGKDTYHYLLTLSKDKLKDLISKIPAQASGDNSSLVMSGIVQGILGNLPDVIGDVNVEVWIGKSDFMLYKIKIDHPIDLNKIYAGFNTNLKIQFTSAYSNFNQPVNVQEPADAIKIENIAVPILRAQKIQLDISQIGLFAKSSFASNKTYVPLCSHNLLNGYLEFFGDDLIVLNNDIVTQGAKKPVCFSGAQSFCVSTQLADGTYLCIDNTGILGKTQCVSASTSCR